MKKAPTSYWIPQQLNEAGNSIYCSLTVLSHSLEYASVSSILSYQGYTDLKVLCVFFQASTTDKVSSLHPDKEVFLLCCERRM